MLRGVNFIRIKAPRWRKHLACAIVNNNSLFTNVLGLCYYKITAVAHFKNSTFIRTHKVSVFYSCKVPQSSFISNCDYQNVYKRKDKGFCFIIYM